MAPGKNYFVERHSTTVLSKLNKQRNEDTFCDVILQVKDEKFPAHRNVLSACSEYFYKMFVINMKEKYKNVVKFQDITVDAMNALLDFLYTESLFVAEENVHELLHAASIMQIEDALGVIISFLGDILNSDNCLHFRKLGCMYSLPKLVANTDQYILEHFEEISVQEEFCDLNQDDLETFLASDELNVDKETLIYEVLVKWINKDVAKRKSDFAKLFGCVRLQFVPIKYLSNTIRNDELVKKFYDMHCRDLVENAMLFHANSELVPAEKPRNSYKTKFYPNTVVLVQTSAISLFNTSQKCWTENVRFDGWKEDMIHERCAVATNFSKSVFCGGLSKDQAINNVVQFDGKCWKHLPSMKVPRCGAAAVYFEEKLYVFGGEKVPVSLYKNTLYGSNSNYYSHNFADDFEKLTDNWSVVGKYSPPCSFGAAQVLENDICLIGGYTFTDPGRFSISQLPTTAAHGLFSPAVGVALAPPVITAAFGGVRKRFDLAPPVTTAAFGSIPKKPLRFSFGSEQEQWKEVCGCTNFYNVEFGTWTKGPNLNFARARFGAAVVNSSIYVLGGFGIKNSSLNSVEFLSKDKKVWTQITKTTPLEIGYSYACIAKNQIYLSTSLKNQLLAKFDPEKEQWNAELGNFIAGAYIIPLSS